MEGPSGWAGSSEVVSTYRNIADFQGYQAAYNAAVSDFDTFQDDCDSAMNRFGRAEDEINNEFTSEEELTVTSNGLNDLAAAAAVDIAEQRSTEQAAFEDYAAKEYQTTQDYVTYLTETINYALEQRTGA